jgi:hypothetical protein
MHYASVFHFSGLRAKAIFDEAKELLACALLVEFVQRLRSVPDNSFGLSVNHCFTSRFRCLIQCDSRSQIPFHLVVEADGQNSKYSPRSDFHMCFNDFPHLLLEVNSQSNESDRYRMLLQASCISRIGNWLRASTSRNPIVNIAIYIDKNYKAIQHLLYQPNVGSTEVRKTG